MKKFNIVAEITEDCFDDAATQIIKSKIREIINSEFDKKLTSTIEECVEKRIQEVNRNAFTRTVIQEDINKEINNKLTKLGIDRKMDDIVSAFAHKYTHKMFVIEKEELERCQKNIKALIGNVVKEELKAALK